MLLRLVSSALAAGAALTGMAQAQSAWTQPDGASFLQLSVQRIGAYDGLYRSSGPDFVTGRELTQSTLEGYGEWGLRDGLTLVGIVPVHYLESGRLTAQPTISPVTVGAGSETLLGNIILGARKALRAGRVYVAGQLNLELPTGSNDTPTGLSSGADAFSLSPTVSVGRGFGSFFTQGYAGLGLRTGDYSNDWRGGVEAGFRIKRWVLAGNLDIVDSFTDGTPRHSPENLQTGLYVNDQEYVAIGCKVLFEATNRFGIQAAVRGAASGNNVAREPFVSVGIFLRR